MRDSHRGLNRVRFDGDRVANGNRVVYVCQTFPWVTQSFTVREVSALLDEGVDVRVVSFRRPDESLIDVAARRLVPLTTYLPAPQDSVLLAPFVRMLRRNPRTLLREAHVGVRSPGLVTTTPAMRMRALLAVIRAAWIAEHCPDAGIFHAEFPDEAATAAMVAAELSGRPFSFKSHASFNPTQLARKARKAAFVATESEFTRTRYFGDLPDDRVLVNRGGVTLGARVRRHTSAGPLRILCVGTLQEKKGQLHLVGALRRLRERGVPFSCLFLGNGPLERRLVEQVAADGLETEVIFRSYLPHDQVERLYTEHDVVVAPAVVASDGDRDGLPAVLIEAAAAGCALVSTAVSGIPELVEDGTSGLVVPQRDEDALADALARLAADPALRQRLGAGARAIVGERFDLRWNVAELAARFEDVLGGKASCARDAESLSA